MLVFQSTPIRVRHARGIVALLAAFAFIAISTPAYGSTPSGKTLATRELRYLHSAAGTVTDATPGSVRTLIYGLDGTKELLHPEVIYVMLVTAKGALEYGVT